MFVTYHKAPWGWTAAVTPHMVGLELTKTEGGWVAAYGSRHSATGKTRDNAVLAVMAEIRQEKPHEAH